MRKSQRGVSILGVIGVLVLLLMVAAFVVPYGFAWYFINKQMRENPGLVLRPVPLPAAAPLVAKGKPHTLTCCGISFDVPWGQPGEPPRASQYSVNYSFGPASPSVMVSKEAARVEPLFVQESLDARTRQSLEQAYGIALPRTRHEAHERVLNYVPRRPSITAMQKIYLEMMMISQKQMLMETYGESGSGIFSFAVPAGRGFQINDPAKSKTIVVHLFDSADSHSQIQIRRGDTEVTQSEVDFVVRSIRPAPAPAPAPAEKGAKPGRPAGKAPSGGSKR